MDGGGGSEISSCRSNHASLWVSLSNGIASVGLQMDLKCAISAVQLRGRSRNVCHFTFMHPKLAFQRWQLLGHLDMSDICAQDCADVDFCRPGRTDALPPPLTCQVVSRFHFLT